MELISIKERLPEPGEKVLWLEFTKGIINNSDYPDSYRFFVDALTGSDEHIEYNEYGKVLEESDVYVYDGEMDLLDEKVTHWAKLPELPRVGQKVDTGVRQSNIPLVSGWLCFNERKDYFNELMAIEGDCLIKFDNGEIRRYCEDEFPFAEVTHFKPF